MERLKRNTPHIEVYFWIGAVSLATLVVAIFALWVRKRNRQQLRQAVTRGDSNRQMTLVYQHLNRHNTQLETGSVIPSGPYEVIYNPVERQTAAIREIPVTEVLLEE